MRGIAHKSEAEPLRFQTEYFRMNLRFCFEYFRSACE